MKTLKVYDDVHTAVKVSAAQEGRTTTHIASSIIRRHFGITESDAESEADEEKEEVAPAMEVAQ